MTNDERREHQRLKLTKPILATFRRANALILDIGIAGAFIEHYGNAKPGDQQNLSFRWQGETVEFVTRVVHSTVVREPAGDGQSAVSLTGLTFVEALDGSRPRLHDLISAFVSSILEAQKANASGEGAQSAGAAVLARLGEARRIRSRGFISYRLKDSIWWRIPTESSKQPADGFTVGSHEDEEELEGLCRTYEASDEEGRQLIRLVAELSLARGRD